MKCISCTRFESNYSSCTGRSTETICSNIAGAREKGNTGWNSVYYQNWWKKLVWVAVTSCCTIFIPSYAFDALLCSWSPDLQDNSNVQLLIELNLGSGRLCLHHIIHLKAIRAATCSIVKSFLCVGLYALVVVRTKTTYNGNGVTVGTSENSTNWLLALQGIKTGDFLVLAIKNPQNNFISFLNLTNFFSSPFWQNLAGVAKAKKHVTQIYVFHHTSSSLA
jgi:hypothetical protein